MSWHVTQSIFCLLNIFIFYGLLHQLQQTTLLIISASLPEIVLCQSTRPETKVEFYRQLLWELRVREHTLHVLFNSLPPDAQFCLLPSHTRNILHCQPPHRLRSWHCWFPNPLFPVHVSNLTHNYTKIAHGKSRWPPQLTELCNILPKCIKPLSSSFQCLENEAQDVLCSRVHSNSRQRRGGKRGTGNS